MIKKLLIILFMCPLFSIGQTFTNATWTPIPETNADIVVPVLVNGLPSNTGTSFGLVSVCLNITHTYVAELVVKLQSPNGTIVLLSDQKGGSGEGYINTCFAENGVNGYINTGVAPFLGSYYPQESLNNFNAGENPNGTWNLILRDVFSPLDTGSLHYVSLTFGLNPPPDPAVTGGPCSASNPSGCQCPDSNSTNCDLLPDLTASALIIQNTRVEFPGHITLGNATPNIGWGPMEIHGIQSCFCDTVAVPCSTTLCPDGSAPKQLLNQRIYHRNANSMTTYDRPAGTMSYHPTHGHVHVDDWAVFTLRVATPNPDASTWPIVGSGTKVSFCLINLGDCDSHPGYCVDNQGNTLLKADIPNSDFGSVSGCGANQGIYVGNLDIYSSGLNGMGVILPPDICNESYYIVSITDPNNNFLESDETNNWAKTPITLQQQLSNDHFQQAGFIYSVSGDRIDVFANALNPDSMVWVWGDGSSTTTAGTLAHHIYSSPGTYVVYSYAYNHCGPAVDADTISIIPVGINTTFETVVSFKAYPNPSKGNSWLTYTLINKSHVKLEVFDQVGKLIKTLVSENQSQGKFRYQFDPESENLPAGVYFARLSTTDKTMNLRMVFVN